MRGGQDELFDFADVSGVNLAFCLCEQFCYAAIEQYCSYLGIGSAHLPDHRGRKCR